MIDDHGTHLFDQDAKKRFDTFIEMSRMEIHKVDVDLSWLKDLAGVL